MNWDKMYDALNAEVERKHEAWLRCRDKLYLLVELRDQFDGDDGGVEPEPSPPVPEPSLPPSIIIPDGKGWRISTAGSHPTIQFRGHTGFNHLRVRFTRYGGSVHRMYGVMSQYNEALTQAQIRTLTGLSISSSQSSLNSLKGVVFLHDPVNHTWAAIPNMMPPFPTD